MVGIQHPKNPASLAAGHQQNTQQQLCRLHLLFSQLAGILRRRTNAAQRLLRQALLSADSRLATPPALLLHRYNPFRGRALPGQQSSCQQVVGYPRQQMAAVHAAVAQQCRGALRPFQRRYSRR